MSQPLIKFTIITLFPEALRPYLDSSMMFKAQQRQIIEVQYVNLRDFGLGPHRSVDDTPYGGGDGMLLRPEPVFAAVEKVKSENPGAEVFIPTPVGEIWTQALARQFAGLAGRSGLEGAEVPSKTHVPLYPDLLQNRAEKAPGVLQRNYVIICPHYEGYDERILTIVDHQISLGNYVLTGGELPALVVIDSITRLLPGVLGGENSALIESFSEGDNLEYPQYTKPAVFRGMAVPEVLLSGHHAKIEQWRQEHTRRRRDNSQI